MTEVADVPLMFWLLPQQATQGDLADFLIHLSVRPLVVLLVVQSVVQEVEVQEPNALWKISIRLLQCIHLSFIHYLRQCLRLRLLLPLLLFGCHMEDTPIDILTRPAVAVSSIIAIFTFF